MNKYSFHLYKLKLYLSGQIKRFMNLRLYCCECCSLENIYSTVLIRCKRYNMIMYSCVERALCKTAGSVRNFVCLYSIFNKKSRLIGLSSAANWPKHGHFTYLPKGRFGFGGGRSRTVKHGSSSHMARKI